MGLIKLAKRIIILACLVYLFMYAWPYVNQYFPNAKERITGYAIDNVIMPAFDKLSEKSGSIGNALIKNKQVVIRFNNSTAG